METKEAEGNRNIDSGSIYTSPVTTRIGDLDEHKNISVNISEIVEKLSFADRVELARRVGVLNIHSKYKITQSVLEERLKKIDFPKEVISDYMETRKSRNQPKDLKKKESRQSKNNSNLQKGINEMRADFQGTNDALMDKIREDQQERKDRIEEMKQFDEVKKIVKATEAEILAYRVFMNKKEFLDFDCECCRVKYHLPTKEMAIAHQLMGNILIGGQGKDMEVIKKNAVLQIKYIAKQSDLFDTEPTKWSYILNHMLGHMLKYFDNPFDLLKYSVDYVSGVYSMSMWNILRRAGGAFVDIFRVGPKKAASNCWAGCIGGFGTDVVDGILLSQEIEVVPAEPILDFCSNAIDVHVPFGTIRQIGCFICEPAFYRVGISIGSIGVTIPRGKCSHNEITFLATRQCTPPLYQSDPRWLMGDRNLRRSIRQEYGDACLRAFYLLNEKLSLPSFPMILELDALEWFLSSKPLKYRERILKGWENKQKCWKQVEYDSVVGRAFGKVEAMCGKERDDVQMRCVTSMTDEYLAESGPIYQYWCKQVLKHLYPDFQTMIQQPVIIVTGMDPKDVGDVVTHFEKEGYFVAQGDHSRFDGHCEEEMIDAEYWFYEQQGCFPEWHLGLMRAQKCTRGVTKTFAYSHKGKVASGKINTSFGDSLINASMWVSFAHEMGIKDSVIMVCGDDHVVFTRDYFPAEDYNKWCRAMGHKNAFEWLLEIKKNFHMPIRADYDDLTFCSSWFMKYNEFGDRVTMPLIGKLLMKTFIPIKPLPDGKTMLEHCVEVAVGLGFYDWVPVLGAFLQVLRKGKKVKPKHEEYQFRMKHDMIDEIDHQVVAIEFAKRYGFDGSQLHEAILRLQLPEGLGVDIKHPLLDRMAERDGVLIPPL